MPSWLWRPLFQAVCAGACAHCLHFTTPALALCRRANQVVVHQQKSKPSWLTARWERHAVTPRGTGLPAPRSRSGLHSHTLPAAVLCSEQRPCTRPSECYEGCGSRTMLDMYFAAGLGPAGAAGPMQITRVYAGRQGCSGTPRADVTVWQQGSPAGGSWPNESHQVSAGRQGCPCTRWRCKRPVRHALSPKGRCQGMQPGRRPYLSVCILVTLRTDQRWQWRGKMEHESRRLAMFDLDVTVSLVRARRAALRAGGSAGREGPCSNPSMGHSIRELWEARSTQENHRAHECEQPWRAGLQLKSPAAAMVWAGRCRSRPCGARLPQRRATWRTLILSTCCVFTRGCSLRGLRSVQARHVLAMITVGCYDMGTSTSSESRAPHTRGSHV